MKTYTIAEISRQTDIPESTLRYRTKLFKKFIPTVGRGRKRKFQECCLKRFKIIDGYFAEGQSTDNIISALEDKYGPEVILEDDKPKKAKNISKKELTKMQERVDIEVMVPMLKIIENQEILIRELRVQNKMLAKPKKRGILSFFL